MREVVNGVMYVLSTGCQWRYIPKDLPPRSTVHDYFTRWNYDGTMRGPLSCQQLCWHAERRSDLGKTLVERVHRSAMLRCGREMQRIACAKA